MYQQGEPLLTDYELKATGKSVVKLHEYYMIACKEGKHSMIIQYKEKHFLSDPNYFLVTWADLYDLFNYTELDTSIIRCWAL